eukprot:1111155-Prorocentrum_minimum.AAC.1
MSSLEDDADLSRPLGRVGACSKVLLEGLQIRQFADASRPRVTGDGVWSSSWGVWGRRVTCWARTS